MPPRTQLPETASDTEIIAAVDAWAALLEAEDYQSAYDATEHVPKSGWTPDFISQAIRGYGDAESGQHVTVSGWPSDVTQRKEVHRYASPRAHGIGYVWYDLNINGLVSDLTATFDLRSEPGKLVLALNDIHVM